MKKQLFFSIILIALVSSCITDYSTETEYVIENKSSQNIVVYFPRFSTGNYVVTDKIINIEINSYFSYTYNNYGDDAPLLEPFNYSDSVLIKLNDTISCFYTKEIPTTKNPLRLESYIGGKKSKGYYKFVYEIRDEDFDVCDDFK